MRFTKMQGTGNDFVVVEAARLPAGISMPELAQALCDRKFHIGADGLLVVSPEPGDGAFTMRMFNPDGSEDTCGNGLRCVSLWAHRAGWLGERREFVVHTKDGIKSLTLQNLFQRGLEASVGVDMGSPHLAPSRIPFIGAVRTDRVVDWPLMVGGRTYPITAVNTGSTHTVVFGPQPDETTFQTVSPQIENHPVFPERTSLLWTTPTGKGAFGRPSFQIRIWERGAGETLGCGTGACAVGVAAILNGLCVPGQPLNINSKGGALRVTWPGEGKSVDMNGGAEIVYDGDYPDSRLAGWADSLEEDRNEARRT